MKLTWPIWITMKKTKRACNDLCFVFIGEFLVAQLGHRLTIKYVPHGQHVSDQL